VRRIRAEEGWRGFYRGLGACLCGVAPEKAVKLAVNEKLREHLAARDHDQFVPPLSLHHLFSLRPLDAEEVRPK
jgi:hypothetical protein